MSLWLCFSWLYLMLLELFSEFVLFFKLYFFSNCTFFKLYFPKLYFPKLCFSNCIISSCVFQTTFFRLSRGDSNGTLSQKWDHSRRLIAFIFLKYRCEYNAMILKIEKDGRHNDEFYNRQATEQVEGMWRLKTESSIGKLSPRLTKQKDKLTLAFKVIL